MCGIYGMIFHSNRHIEKLPEVRKFFTAMAHEAVARGDDAAGAAVVGHDFGVAIYKNSLPSTKVVGFRRWSRLLRGIGSNTLGVMGHTRLGTHGENTIKNAHPFLFDDAVVGTHNGVISNHERFGPVKPFECDSANVIYRLGVLPRADWSDFLEALNGSFALAFATKEGFHLARNSSSPCELAYIAEFDATVYASTNTIIFAGVRAAQVACQVRQSFPTGEIWTFKPGTTEHHITKFKASSYSYCRAPGDGAYYYNNHKVSIEPAKKHWVTGGTGTGIIGIEHAIMGRGQCENCGEIHNALMDHPEGAVCMDCYDDLYLDALDDGDDDPHHKESDICDMCSRESELFRFENTENFLCRWCSAELRKDKPSREVICEGCTKVGYTTDIGRSMHVISDERTGDTYACTECMERWGGVDRVLDAVEYCETN